LDVQIRIICALTLHKRYSTVACFRSHTSASNTNKDLSQSKPTRLLTI